MRTLARRLHDRLVDAVYESIDKNGRLTDVDLVVLGAAHCLRSAGRLPSLRRARSR
jgi:hypothetical protein